MSISTSLRNFLNVHLKILRRRSLYDFSMSLFCSYFCSNLLENYFLFFIFSHLVYIVMQWFFLHNCFQNIIRIQNI